MRSLPNIERSAFKRGRYVGYSHVATWHIWRDRSSRWWWASARGDVARLLRGETLTELSQKLSAEA